MSAPPSPAGSVASDSDSSELCGAASEASSAPPSPVRLAPAATLNPFTPPAAAAPAAEPSAAAAASDDETPAARVARLIAAMKAKVAAERRAAPAVPPLAAVAPGAPHSHFHQKVKRSGGSAQQSSARRRFTPLDVSADFEMDLRPGVVHLPASEFRDDDFDQIARERARYNANLLTRVKSPGAVKRMLARAGSIGVPAKADKKELQMQPFSFDAMDAERATLKQLADFRPQPTMFNPLEYHAERAEELERVRQIGRGSYKPPPPLTVPQSPHLATRERGDVAIERRLAQRDESANHSDDEARAAYSDTVRGVDFAHYGEPSPDRRAAPFKSELTIPESPCFRIDERGEVRREMAERRAQAEAEREERERAEQALRVARALECRPPQIVHKHELTIPESPGLMTRERAEARSELMNSIRAQRESESAAAAASSSYSSGDGTRVPNFEHFGAYEKTERKPYRSELTIPESPMFATNARGELRREYREAQHELEQQRLLREAEEERAQQEARLANERHAARQYVAQRRALTVPESPALWTRMRGEVHAERFAQLVEEEEERADQIEHERRAFGAEVLANKPRSASALAALPPQLTIPESPCLMTKQRGDVYRSMFEEERSRAERTPPQFSAAEYHEARRAQVEAARSYRGAVGPAKQLTVPESPLFYTRARAEDAENIRASAGDAAFDSDAF